MDYAKITGIISASALEKVERRLIKERVAGLTVTKVRGYGELKDFFSRDLLVTHVRIEVFALTQDATRICNAIMEEARSGESGDGIVAILPVLEVLKIRTGAPMGAGST